MSVKIMTRVWEDCPQKAEALIVMLALADWCNDSGQCWPSLMKLAEKARISERAVFNIVRRLEEAGEITIVTSRGRGRTNTYNLTRYAGKHEQASGISAPIPDPASGFATPIPEPASGFPAPENLNATPENLNAATCIKEEPLLDPSTSKEPSTSSAPDGAVVRAAARTTRHAPTEGMGEGISEPNDAPTSKPSRPSKPARPAEPTPTRQRPRATPKPQAPQAPEEREGPFREVFQAICRVRRQSPDILAEEDRANTRRLTSTLCRAGVEDRETVEGWGRGWYVDMATRTRRRASQVSAPTIAQLTTWFGGRIAERDGAHLTIETTTGADSGWMTN